jgi:hypothetical protein
MKKISIVIFLWLSILSSSVFSKYYWPTFTYPKKKLLLKLNMLTNNSCPAGQVKLINHSTVNVNECDSQRSCPSNWEWLGKSNEQCHELNDVDFLNYKITHHPENHYWQYTTVTAFYGSKATGEIYFEYVMTTPLGEYWFCRNDTYASGFIVDCANDY